MGDLTVSSQIMPADRFVKPTDEYEVDKDDNKAKRERGTASHDVSPQLLPNLIHHPPVLLGPADLLHRIQAGKNKLDARRADVRIARRVHFKRLIPKRRNALQPVGVVF